MKAATVYNIICCYENNAKSTMPLYSEVEMWELKKKQSIWQLNFGNIAARRRR